MNTCLESGVPYILDIDNKAPFDLCLKRNNLKGTTLIIKYLAQTENINSYMDSDSFYYSMTHNGKEMRNLLNKTLFLPSNPTGDLELPIIGKLITSKLFYWQDHVMFEDETRNISTNQVQKYVNMNHDKQKIITCTSSRISINFFLGSNDSLFFLR